MKADGTIYIDTSINTDGIQIGTKDLDAAAKKMADAAESIAKSLKDAFKDNGMNEARKSAQGLEATTSDLQNQIKSLQEEVTRLKGNLVELGNADAQKDPTKEIAATAQSANEEVTALTNKVTALEQTISEIKSGSTEMIGAFETKIASLESVIADLQNKLNAANAAKKELESSGQIRPTEYEAPYKEQLIPNTDFTAMEESAKSMEKTVEGMGKKVEIAVQKSVNAFVKQNQAVSQQQDKVKDLQQQLQELEGQKVETDAYKAVNAEIKKLDESINAADAKKRKFLETGGSETSKTFQNLEYDTQQMSAEMDSLLDKKKKLESSGAAYAPVDTSALRSKLASETGKLANMNSRLSTSYDELKLKVDTYNQKLHETENSTKKAAKSTNKFGNRLKSIISGALVFNVISSGLRKMTSYFGTALKSNSEFSASLARLKGALLTAFQPIYEVVLPALITLMRILTAIIQVIGRFFAAITGKSYNQMAKNAEALNNQANAIGGVGDAAEEAEKQLMGFDEINKLSEPDVSSGGGGGVGGADLTPIFDDTEIAKSMERILYLIGAIGAALLTWKIARAFTDSLNLAAGLAMAVGGAILYAFNWADAFSNGIDWGNLAGMLVGMLAIVLGLGLAFGPVGAAIGLLVTGIGLVVLALREWITTGELSNEACTALVAGIVAIGAAIALFTGSWIPILIAAIVGFVVAAVTKGQEIKDALNKFSDWLKNIFCRDWTEVFGVILGTKLNLFVGIVSGILGGLKQMFFGLIDFIQGVFTGNWAQAWDGLCNIAKGAINGIIGVLNGMISAVVNGVNALFRLLSFNIDLPGGKNIGISLPQFTPPQIPYLAKGAVIPPKSPFMAVLGDQRHGNNIEAPEDLIRKIVREEAGNAAGEWILNVSFDGDLAQLIRLLAPKITAQQKKTDRALGV